MEIYNEAPQNFSPQMHVAACYLEFDQKFLFLKRAAHKLVEPGKWGVPAGKLEANETSLQAAMRELFEETSIRIDLSQIQSAGTLYVRIPGVDFVYYLFKVSIDYFPAVVLSDEHQSYIWASLEELSQLPLMTGALEALSYYCLK